MDDYNGQKKLPRYINKAIRNGYIIQHKALLAWCSIPEATAIPCYRFVVIGLEAVLAC
jgi:hypothetical protein